MPRKKVELVNSDVKSILVVVDLANGGLVADWVECNPSFELTVLEHIIVGLYWLLGKCPITTAHQGVRHSWNRLYLRENVARFPLLHWMQTHRERKYACTLYMRIPSKIGFELIEGLKSSFHRFLWWNHWPSEGMYFRRISQRKGIQSIYEDKSPQDSH